MSAATPTTAQPWAGPVTKKAFLSVRRTIVCNPASDADFRRLTEQLGRRAATPAELELRLREQYPGARVVDGIASGFGSIRWYAYRDGHWLSSGSGGGSGQTIDGEP